MGQLMACATAEGVLVAPDSKALWFEPYGEERVISLNRVTEVFTLPRRLGLEFTLNDMVKKKAPLAQLAATAKAGMEKLAQGDDTIGLPYHYVTVTAQGIKQV